jgi:thiosulfate/3-mercaptopyruvate sulfurtransferase
MPASHGGRAEALAKAGHPQRVLTPMLAFGFLGLRLAWPQALCSYDIVAPAACRAGDNMAFTTVIDAGALARHLNDPDCAVVDCRFRLDDPAWGEREYAVLHIPGAVHADLDRDLSGEKTGTNGRHPLPPIDRLTPTLGRLGIGRGVQVVAYDQDTGMYASRLWWLLRWLGHDLVAVLDGGFANWVIEGHPTATGREPRAPRRFVGAPRPDAVASVDDVAALLNRSDWRLLDARAPERFSGAVEPIDNAAGHIPGAANYFFKSNLDDRGRFRPPDDLRRRIGEALGGVAPEHAVSYCGSGVTACHNLLAMEHAGLHGAKLYPGSWSEWSSDPERPVEKVRSEK